MAARSVWKSTPTMVGLAAVVGCVAGGGAVAFEYLSQFVFHVLLARGAGYDPAGPLGETDIFPHAVGEISMWWLVLIPALGGLVSGYICTKFAPEARGHGTDAAIDAYHSGGGRIRGVVPLVKAITTAISLGSGGSGGREGPIAQIGAGFGSLLATTLKMSAKQRRILLAAGMGAGVGAIFRAPLAGAIFAAEILYRDAEIESEVVLPSFISAATAYCVFCGWFGEFGTLFEIPGSTTFDDLTDMGPYTLLGLGLVPIIYLYIKVFYGLERVFDRIRGPRSLVTALGGLLTGVVGVGLWKLTDDTDSLAVMSYGYGVLQQGLLGAFTGWTGVRLLVLIALFKILTTSFTISSGGSGGVFGPSMVIGGGIGGAVGIACQQMGWVEDPTAFFVVGMCGFFAGAARTPISTIIMVSEMTGSYELLLPAMWVCAITFILCSRWTLYDKQVPSRAYSPAHRGEFMIPLLQDMKVRDVIEEERAFATVSLRASLAEVVHVIADTHADYFPVLDDDGHLVGIFSAHDVRSFTYDDTLHHLAVAADIMTTDLITVTPDDDLHVALRRFSKKNIDELPIVDPDDPRKLLGMLRRRAMTRAYQARHDEVLRAKED